MLVPIGHDKKTVTRLPIVTAILIVVNILVFVFTINSISRGESNGNIVAVRTRILILKARFPDLTVTPEVQKLMDEIKTQKPEAWTWLTSKDRKPDDEWEAELLLDPHPQMDQLQAQMDELCSEFAKLWRFNNSLVWKYGYHSYQPQLPSYITHQYLHGGVVHLVGNMWFLYLCGVVLEDVWGPFLLLPFYTVAGVVAALFYGWVSPNSTVALIGASGAVAGLMGALLVRFPKLNIKVWYFWIFRIRGGTFKAPVYLLVPLWFFAELFWGLMGDASGVAHWAHVGGFAFGMMAGIALYAMKVEDVVNRSEPGEIWVPDEDYLEALDALEQRRDATACIASLRQALARDPNSLEAWQLMLRAQNWGRDHDAERDETLPNLVRVSLAKGDQEQALTYASQYRSLGGTQLAPATWIELARKFEKDQQWEAAAREHEQLGLLYYDKDPISLTALMSAARIHLSKLNQVEDAERLYRAAQGSSLPHLDLEGLIHQGLKQCASSTNTVPRGAVGGASASS